MTQTQPNLATEERLHWLKSTLDAEGSISLVDAAAELGVSTMTIRRDIAELETRGLARRVRGGALPLGPQSFAERKGLQTRAKSKIASKLADLIPATGTIAFDASSTIMRAAATLGGAQDLTILTNGPDTFSALQGRPGVTPLLTGGQLDGRTGSLVGPMASWAARQLTTQVFFCSSSALSITSGATEVVLAEAEVKRSIAERSSQIVLALDHSKLERQAPAVCLEWNAIDVLVTELDPTDRRLDRYRDLVTIR
jgi:DeoR family transcriptional regulator, fructose operon transcriptional repressor